MSPADQLQKFLLQQRGARVIAVDLQQTWRTAQSNQPEFPAVRTLLGELVAAAALLSANLKFDGSLMLQLQGNGVVKLIVVECRQDLSFRATIKLRHDPSPEQQGLQTLLNQDGQGRFSVILNPPKDKPGRQPYQGIVPLNSESVAGVLEHYMAQSEQLQTRLWLGANADRTTGVLLQRMPNTGGQSESTPEQMQESWQHALALCDTISTQELAQVSMDTLLKRLFWETPIVNLETLPVTWHCGCNRERVADMLRSLGASEVQDIVAEQGLVEVICDFCATPYRFDSVDAVSLFKTIADQPNQQLH